MRISTYLTNLAAGVCVTALAAVAAAQAPGPPNSVPYEDKGTLEAVSDDAVRFNDSKNQVWQFTIGQDATVSVAGEADRDFLRPGMTVQFEAKLDKKGAVQGALEEIEIVSFQGKSITGIYTPGEDDEDAKPVRNLVAGTYRIHGRVTSFKDNKLIVVAGRTKVTGSVGDDMELKVSVDDPTLAQAGDPVEVKGWFTSRPVLTQPGSGLAHEVSITLSNKLTGGSKKRSAAGSAKSVKALKGLKGPK